MVGVEEEEMKWNEEKRGRVGKIVHSVFSCLVEYSWLLQTLCLSSADDSTRWKKYKLY